VGVGGIDSDVMPQKPGHINVDPDDWDDVLHKIEASYEIKFQNNELVHVRTLGELIDAIEAKVLGTDASDCSTQQAFYKVRSALAVQLELNPSLIRPDAKLEELVPRKVRRHTFKNIDTNLGVELRVFRLKQWIVLFLSFLFLGSLVAFIWSTQLALGGLVAFALLLSTAWAFTTELNVDTIGELAARSSQRAYKIMRRDYGTVNRNEIKAKLMSLFQEELGLEEHDLRDDILIVP